MKRLASDQLTPEATLQARSLIQTLTQLNDDDLRVVATAVTEESNRRLNATNATRVTAIRATIEECISTSEWPDWEPENIDAYWQNINITSSEREVVIAVDPKGVTVRRYAPQEPGAHGMIEYRMTDAETDELLPGPFLWRSQISLDVLNPTTMQATHEMFRRHAAIALFIWPHLRQFLKRPGEPIFGVPGVAITASCLM